MRGDFGFMLKIVGAVAQAARPVAFASAAALTAAFLLGGCASGYQSEYNSPNGKVLLVTKEDWADYQKYLGKIGSTHDGAFAMGVSNGKSAGWASSSCGYDVCYGGNAANDAMRMCREGGECVLFATDDRILVNYKLEGQ
jgi:hypothetical protein